jgi:hypothetical protein
LTACTIAEVSPPPTSTVNVMRISANPDASRNLHHCFRAVCSRIARAPEAKRTPEDYASMMVVERLVLPDGTRVLLSTGGVRPRRSRQRRRTCVSGRRSVDLGAPQQTKTRIALAALAARFEEEEEQ